MFLSRDMGSDASWRDSIQRYDQEKRIDPSYVEVLPKRQYRDSRTCQKDRQREYDVLTHQWRNDHKEVEMSNQELALDLAAMEVAKERAMRYESHYDVINNNKKVTAPKTPPPKPVYEPEPFVRPPPRQTGLSRYYWPNADKDFHVISNRYLSEHDTQSRRDHDQAINDAATKFAQTSYYNAVQGKMYDPDEEKRFVDARLSAQANHGQSKQSRLPAMIKKREGASYDIIAPHVVLNREQMAEMEAFEAEARKNKGQDKAAFEPGQSQSHINNEARMLNRISHQRFLDETDRGYNILNNQDFKGRTGRSGIFSYPPRTQIPRESALRPKMPFARTEPRKGIR